MAAVRAQYVPVKRQRRKAEALCDLGHGDRRIGEGGRVSRSNSLAGYWARFIGDEPQRLAALLNREKMVMIRYT